MSQAVDKTLTAILGDAVAKQLERAAGSPYLLLVFFGSILMSIASFYTTFDGMLMFMPFIIICLFITFAIQALLFVSSWQIGFMVAQEAPTSWMNIIIFVICFLTSVFFSFSSLFESIYDPKLEQRTSITRIHNTVEGTVTDLELRVEKYTQELAKKLLEADAYQRWYENVLKVAEAAVNGSAQLRTILEQRHRARAAEAFALREEATTIENSKSVIQDEITRSQLREQTLKTQRESLLSRIQTLQKEYQDARQLAHDKKVEMDAEAAGGNPAEKRLHGKGPVWRKLRNEYRILLTKSEGKKDELISAQRSLKKAENDIVTVQSILAGKTAEVETIDERIEESKRKAKTAEQAYEAMGTQKTFDPEAIVQHLKQNLAEFSKSFLIEPFDKAAAVCDSLLEEMNRQSDLRATVAGASCDRGGMALYMNPIANAEKNLTALRTACVKSNTVVTDLSFDEAVSYGRLCINTAGLPSHQVSDLRAEIDRLVREESPDASKFTKTANAIMAGEKLAWFSLLIALAMDLIVLFSGLVGAKSLQRNAMDVFLDLELRKTDPLQFRIIKVLLAHAEPAHQHKDGFDFEINTDPKNLPQHHKELRQALGAQIKRGHTKLADKKGCFYIKGKYLEELRYELAEYQKDQPFMHEAPPRQPLHQTPGHHSPPHQPSGTGGDIFANVGYDDFQPVSQGLGYSDPSLATREEKVRQPVQQTDDEWEFKQSDSDDSGDDALSRFLR